MNFLPKNIFKIFLVLIFSWFLINVSLVFAAENLSNWETQLDNGASTKYDTSQGSSRNIADYVGTLIKWTPMLGITFIVQIVLAGYEWMNASGDSAKLEEAKKRITHAVIGFVLFIGLYAISYYIFDKLTFVAGV